MIGNGGLVSNAGGLRKLFSLVVSPPMSRIAWSAPRGKELE